MHRHALPAAVLVLLQCVATGTAQPGEEPSPLAEPPPLDAKEVAKAKFEAAHADPTTVARERLRAAAAAYRGGAVEYGAARGTARSVLIAVRGLLEAELAAGLDEADALERSWERLWRLERRAEARDRSDAARRDSLTVRYARLDTERRLGEARRRRRPGVGPAGAAPLPRPDQDADTGAFARARFAAAHADPKALAEAQLRVALQEYQEARAAALIGKLPLTHVVEPAYVHVLEAARLVAQGQGVLEEYWKQAAWVAVVTRAKYEAGLLGGDRLAQARDLALEADAWLARAGVGKTRGSDATLRTLGLEDPAWAGVLLDTKDLAKRQFEALHTDARGREKRRVEAARAAYTAFRYGDRQGGVPSEDGLHLSRRLLEAELAASSTDAERQSARERYWARALLLETVRKARLDIGGQVSRCDYLQARAARLAAEPALARGRTRQDGR